jgi:hypothetical protein
VRVHVAIGACCAWWQLLQLQLGGGDSWPLGHSSSCISVCSPSVRVRGIALSAWVTLDAGGWRVGKALGDDSSGGLVWLLDTAALIKGAGWSVYTAMIHM